VRRVECDLKADDYWLNILREEVYDGLTEEVVINTRICDVWFVLSGGVGVNSTCTVQTYRLTS
jgi:hypothetical protein